MYIILHFVMHINKMYPLPSPLPLGEGMHNYSLPLEEGMHDYSLPLGEETRTFPLSLWERARERAYGNVQEFTMKTTTNSLRSNAKNLRSAQTKAEHLLWYYLRAHRLNGLKFKRQVVIGTYIVDFVCESQGIIVEVDGGQHAEQEKYDATRTKYLESQGYRVLRFWNNEVLGHSDSVLDMIWRACKAPANQKGPLPHPLPEGEGKIWKSVISTPIPAAATHASLPRVRVDNLG
jgi:very-short-patch-repair endonuclease